MTFIISHAASNNQIYLLSNPDGTNGLLVSRIEISHLAAANFATVTLDRVSSTTGSPVTHSVLDVRDGSYTPQWAPITASVSFAGIKYAGNGSPLVLPFADALEFRNAHALLYLIQGADGSSYDVNLHCDEY